MITRPMPVVRSFGIAVVFAVLALASLSPANAQETTSATFSISSSPQDIVLPADGDAGGNIAFPSSNAIPGTKLSLTVRSGPDPSEKSTEQLGAVESIRLTFDRNVTFDEYPSFYASLPKNFNPEDPFDLIIRDDGDQSTVVNLDQFEYGGFVFMGGSWHGNDFSPFKALAHHTYEADIYASPSSMTRLNASLMPEMLTLPPLGGISGTVSVPPLLSGGGTLLLRSSATPPLGMPAPSGDGPPPLYYATLLVRGVVSYNGEISATVVVPLSESKSDSDYVVAVYDNGNWTKGWSVIATAHANRGQNKLSFSLDLPATKLSFRRYAIAIIKRPAGWTPTEHPENATSGRKPVFAIVGDSLSFLTAFPADTPCRITLGPSPICQYTIDPEVAYPDVLANRLGYRVVNLAWPAIELGGDSSGESALSLEIPQIPPNSEFVVLEAGNVDVVVHPKTDRSSVLDEATAAIHARAPKARIVYMGVRYLSQTLTDPDRKPGIDEWNARAKTLAAQNGAYIDMAQLFPPGINSAFPDGNHASINAHRTIAKAIADAVATLQLSR